MMTTENTIGHAQRIVRAAREADGWLTRHESKGGPGIERILIRKDDAPEWVSDLCREAHEDGGSLMLPDDWRHEFLQDALDLLIDLDPDDDDDSDWVEDQASERALEFFDGRYIYTAERTGWLHSRNDRPALVDEAVEEWGQDSVVDCSGAIWLGMLGEFRHVLMLTVHFLRDHTED